jgi:hypothetical protein
MIDMVFNLRQVKAGFICRFAVKCSREGNKDIYFELDGGEAEMPLREKGSSG